MSTLPDSPFLECLLRFLIPYFTGVTADIAAARAEALETLASYGARTRAELLCAAHAIAFSLAALDTLTEAKTTDMTASLRLRYRGCANNLNRNFQKTEAILAKRLACDLPDTTSAQDLANDIPEPEAPEILQQTQAAIQSFRTHTSARRPAQGPQPIPQSQKQRNNRLWGAAMMETLAQMGMPVTPASPA